MYFDWSQDSRHIIVHINDELLLMEYENGQRVSSQRIGAGSIAYRAPQWSPNGDRYLYVDLVDGERILVLGEVDKEPILLGPADESTAFRWSPSGDRIGVMGGRFGAFFDAFTVLTPDGKPTGVTASGQFFGFWWAPDGEHVVIASDGLAFGPKIESVLIQNQNDDGVIGWAVVNTETGRTRVIGGVLPTNELIVMLTFFDQFAQTMQIWSPDSRFFLVPGALRGLDEFTENQYEEVNPEVATVWRMDATGDLPPLAIGEGTIASWSQDFVPR